MVTGWLWGGFALVSALMALAVFPPWRRALAGTVRLIARSSRSPRSSRVSRASQWGPGRAPGWRLLPIGVVTVAAPVAVVLVWGARGTRVLDGFDDRIGPANEQVARLLAGERLVPPPPLPPAVFTTAEVETVRPMLASADRRWEQMDAPFVQRLLAVFKMMKDEHGYDMALLEGYRSPERQAMLAAKGSSVTMAGAWQSYHQYGLAADCAFYRDGKLVISEKDPWAMRGYQLYGQLAERMGLTWGGRWQMMDLGHVEWRTPEARAAMRAAVNR